MDDYENIYELEENPTKIAAENVMIIDRDL